MPPARHGGDNQPGRAVTGLPQGGQDGRGRVQVGHGDRVGRGPERGGNRRLRTLLHRERLGERAMTPLNRPGSVSRAADTVAAPRLNASWRASTLARRAFLFKDFCLVMHVLAP